MFWKLKRTVICSFYIHQAWPCLQFKCLASESSSNITVWPGSSGIFFHPWQHVIQGRWGILSVLHGQSWEFGYMFTICWAWEAGRQLKGRVIWHIIQGVQGVKLRWAHAGILGGRAELTGAGRLHGCRSQTVPAQPLCRLHPGLLPGIPLHPQTQTWLRFLAVS